MDEEAAAQFWFKPGAFWGHDLACIGDVHELLDGGWVHGEGDGAFARFDALFEFVGTADSADEVDPLAGAGIFDAEERVEETFLEASDIESTDGVSVLSGGP